MASGSNKENQISLPIDVTCFWRVSYNNMMTNNASERGIIFKVASFFLRIPEEIQIISVTDPYLDEQQAICQVSDICPLSGVCSGRGVVKLNPDIQEGSSNINREIFFKPKLKE